jgi:hypothetical protein
MMLYVYVLAFRKTWKLEVMIGVSLPGLLFSN